MRIPRLIALGSLGCASLLATMLHGEDAHFRLTLRVIDDVGQPVAGAYVRIGAEARVTEPWREGGKGVFAEGLTNKEGLFSGEVETIDARLAGYSVQKDGYYRTRLSYSAQYPPVKGRWEPWNPTIELVLKRIKSPVPMYAKHVQLKVPEFDKPIGYDLVIGDWVSPFGKGEKSDFIFEARRNVRSDRDYEGSLSLRFSNLADGLIPFDQPQADGSELRLPYQAPENGYLEEKTWREARQHEPDGRDKVLSDASRTMNYFFRVRTLVDAQGRVVSAYYGKLHGDVRFFIGTLAPTSGLAFTYYLNPDGTRNVEFDPQRNLFKPAKRDDSAFWNLGP